MREQQKKSLLLEIKRRATQQDAITELESELQQIQTNVQNNQENDFKLNKAKEAELDAWWKQEVDQIQQSLLMPREPKKVQTPRGMKTLFTPRGVNLVSTPRSRQLKQISQPIASPMNFKLNSD